MTLLVLVLVYLLGGIPAATYGSASGSAVASTNASAALAITVWPSGPTGRSVRWTLRCRPTAGSLPQPGAACRRLSALAKPFAPVPRGRACIALYGGPQVARVQGTFRGSRVDARFKRIDGCEIERWDRVRFLFPVRR